MFAFNSTPEQEKEINNILNLINNKEIPSQYPKHMTEGINNFRTREKIISQLGFALICKEWIEPLARWIGDRKCLEVMSGTGALAYSLKQYNVDIIATDDFSWNKGNKAVKFKDYWTHIENMDAIESVKKYGSDVNIIIMSWAYMDDTAYKVLQAMREINPFCIMIFIGEGEGGCTADDNFYQAIKELENSEFDEINKIYPKWFGIHDTLWLVK